MNLFDCIALRALLLGLWVAGAAHAHVVRQLFADVQRTGPDWRIEVLFDAGYADPATRGDPDTPQPSRDWLIDLSDEEQRELCGQAADYLAECLEISTGQNIVRTSFHFVDFDKTPPDFPSLLTDGAYVRIRMFAENPGAPASIRCKLAAGDRPDFVFKFAAVDGGEPRYLTLRPGESALLWHDEASRKTGTLEAFGRRPLVHAFEAGFLHVIPRGLDHLLFVLGLFLLSRSWRPLLWQSLAFTIAHTLTLGLAAAGILAPRSEWIEPLIALSIALVAVENLFHTKLSAWRMPLVFGFGLIHGLGFASALAVPLSPGERFLSRLGAANLGVEVAQIAILAGAWILTTGWSSGKRYRVFRKYANLLLAAVALCWFYQRVA